MTRSARHSDLDHLHDAALGGATTEQNLGTECRRHHVLKHHSPWHVQPLTAGLLEWTSPTGRTYIDRPPPQNTVTFTEPPDEHEPGDGEPPRDGEPAELWSTAPPELLAPF